VWNKWGHTNINIYESLKGTVAITANGFLSLPKIITKVIEEPLGNPSYFCVTQIKIMFQVGLVNFYYKTKTQSEK